MGFPSPPPVVRCTVSIRLHDRLKAMTEPPLQPSALEELPLPYRFDVQALDQIRFAPLLEHIQRVEVVIYTMAGIDSDACGLRAYNPSRAGCNKDGQP